MTALTPSRPASALAALLLLVSCGETAHRPATKQPSAPQPAACRVGPEGGPPLADRGIGGTGGPVSLADRGIGGTGGPALADRGIGGTGIIGVITGFASVCLAGQEVALPAGVPVTLESQPADISALRAGQVAAISAAPGIDGLSARRIMIRFEVIGAVEARRGDELRVAGQTVHVGPNTWGIRPDIGDMVAVSGLRRGDGTIEATRIEPHRSGAVLIHGRLTEESGVLRLGALRLDAGPAAALLVGRDVTVVGSLLLGNDLVVDRIEPDTLASDPAAYFGPVVGVVLVEAFGDIEAGRLHLGHFSAPAAANFRVDAAGRGVFRLERRGDHWQAVGTGAPMHAAPGNRFEPGPDLISGPHDGARFEPAPMPNRAFGPPSRNFDADRGVGRLRPGGAVGRINAPRPGDNGEGPGRRSPNRQ